MEAHESKRHIEAVGGAGFRFGTQALVVIVGGLCGAAACAQGSARIETERGEATVLVEPYAPNIVRVSLSLRRADALAAPGYGVVARPAPGGWTVESGVGGDVLRSAGLIVTVAPQGPKGTPAGTQADIARFFNGSTPGVALSLKTPDGKTLLEMNGWEMAVPNYKDGNHDVEYDRRPSDPPFSRSAPALRQRTMSTTTVWDRTRKDFSIGAVT